MTNAQWNKLIAVVNDDPQSNVLACKILMFIR